MKQHFVLFFFFLLLVQFRVFAQETDTSALQFSNDSAAVNTLEEVSITAFSLQSRWQQIPAAIAVLGEKQLQLVSPVSMVPAFNTVAGVRMEERSPGSYRLSIRGSLLRSPFGVRNVKMYWNDIPLTDAGGNTYLNIVDVSQLQSVEIIKGPASSLYGANTGGAVLLYSGSYLPKHHLSGTVTGGSYGLFNQQVKWTYANRNFESGVQQVHQQSDGYRDHSAMRRDAVKWDGSWQISSREKLSFLAFYSNLHYQTPGGLTSSQLHTDTTAYPRAVEQHNGVYNTTVFGGLSLHSDFSQHFDNVTTLTANHTLFKNPFTTNYEIRDELNTGARSVFSYHTSTQTLAFQWLAGAEWLHNQSQIDNYDNNAGVKGNVQFKDQLKAIQSSFFSQANLQLNQRFTVQAGISFNEQTIQYRRPADSALHQYQKSNARSLAAPRLSALYTLAKDVHIYVVAAKGFSTPSLAELHPSNGSFNRDLRAEYGWNYELGFKGSLLCKRLWFDVSAYSFGLRDAIVKRSSATVQEFYVNAGKTKQQGVEAWLKGFVISNGDGFVSNLAISNSFSYQPYRFDSYIINQSDYSGNPITGVPRTVQVTTIGAASKSGMYANLILNNTSSLSLNDAETETAKPYHLLQAKLGWQTLKKNLQYHFFAGADNLLNEQYSLGNDINAFGKRYYNPAPKRNYYAGVQVSL